MISFKKHFLQESVMSMKRQGLTHLTEMKPYIFIEWLDSVKKEAKGYLPSNVKAVLKVDGMGFKFGKDKNGKIFVETSRSGPQFNDNAFSQYAIAKSSNEEVVVRAKQFDDILKFFKQNKTFVQSIPNDTKVYCELFYTPMASLKDETGIKFVTVKYDKNKVGSFMTILPYNVFEASSGKEHTDKENILNILFRQSNKTVKIVDPSLSISGSININGFIDPIESLLKNKLETIRILKSRKKMDKEKKLNYLSLIRDVQFKLSEHLLWNPNICGTDKLCDPKTGEGLVFHLGDEFGSVKVINPQFQIAHHGKIK